VCLWLLMFLTLRSSVLLAWVRGVAFGLITVTYHLASPLTLQLNELGLPVHPLFEFLVFLVQA